MEPGSAKTKIMRQTQHIRCVNGTVTVVPVEGYREPRYWIKNNGKTVGDRSLTHLEARQVIEDEVERLGGRVRPGLASHSAKGLALINGNSKFTQPQPGSETASATQIVNNLLS